MSIYSCNQSYNIYTLICIFAHCIASTLYAKDNIAVENLTSQQLYVATYGLSSGKRTDNGVRMVPPGGSTTIPQPSSSFFPTTNFVVSAAKSAEKLGDQLVAKPYEYSVISSGLSKSTKKIILQKLGTGIGATADNGNNNITIVNESDNKIHLALYYDDHTTAYRWGNVYPIEPQEELSLLRPERKCFKKTLDTCTKYYDRNVYLASNIDELSATLTHNKLPFMNVGDAKGKSFLVYSIDDILYGGPKLLANAEKIGKTSKKLLQPDVKKIKEKYNALSYPGKNETAYVRESEALSDKETAFRLKRANAHIRPACKAIFKKLYNKDLPDEVPTPTIALCVSGGGCRAMFVLAGLLAAAEQLNFLPFLSYIATLSGSTWALASWLYYDKSAREHLNYLCKQFESGILGDFNVLQVQEAVLRKAAYGQPASIIDIYGALLGDKIFKSYAPHKNPNELFWGIPLTKVESAEVPFPLYTAVTPRHFSDLKLSGDPFNYYHWLTFDPYEVTVDNKSIPSWALGRFFANNTSTESIPPLSVGYLLGMFGSAMSINQQDTTNIVLKSIQPSYADKLTALSLKSDTLRLLMQQRASPAKVPNWIAEGLMTIVDGGMSLIFPFPPLLKRERTVDIIISVDGSAGIKLAPGLRGFKDYLQKKNIKFPEIDLSMVGKKPYTIIWDASNSEVPMLIHLPLINHPTYKNNWDPETSLWSNTFNFIYSEENAKKLSGLSEVMFNEAHSAIENAIGEWLANQATNITELPAEPA